MIFLFLWLVSSSKIRQREGEEEWGWGCDLDFLLSRLGRWWKLTFPLEACFFMGYSEIIPFTRDHSAEVLWRMANASLFLLATWFFVKPFASNNTWFFFSLSFSLSLPLCLCHRIYSCLSKLWECWPFPAEPVFTCSFIKAASIPLSPSVEFLGRSQTLFY